MRLPATGPGSQSDSAPGSARRNRPITDGGISRTEEGESDVLATVAEDAFSFFETFTTDAGLVPDVVEMDDGKVAHRQHRTSPSNVAMGLLSTVAADELGVVSTTEAAQRAERTVETLASTETWNGLFYRWFDSRDGSLTEPREERHISTVDNGHLTAALATVSQAYPRLEDRCQELLDAQDYSGFHCEETGRMRGAYYLGDEEFGDWTYTFINSENRVASFCAIGKGDVPKSHWWRPLRTYLPDSEEGRQTPEGEWRTYDGVDVYEGHYHHDGHEFVPAWGGALFVSLMPSLFIDEDRSGDAWRPNNEAHVALQIAYADEQDWPVWGLSSCGLPDGYGTFGVPYTAAADGYRTGPWVTPHATGLAASVDPAAARENLRSFHEMGVDGPYGLYDSVNAETGEVAERYYSLDQGMLVCGLANAVTAGALREYFHDHPLGAEPVDLLEREEFTI